MAIRPFFETLREIRYGGLLDDAAKELNRAVKAVDETGKAAKLLIELTITPESKSQGVFAISDKVSLKLPSMPSGKTLLFATPEGNLQRGDPKQNEMELRDVTAPAAVQAESLKKVG